MSNITGEFPDEPGFTGDVGDDIELNLEVGSSSGFDFESESAFDAALEAAFDEDIEILPRRRHLVTAVLVSHNGATWLPAVLTQLAGQSIPPSAVVGVNAASSDASGTVLRESLGADRVVNLDRNDGFGEAVRAGLSRVSLPESDPDVVEWVWLLHDDSAPDAGCLEALLNCADDNPGVAIFGPKILGWHDRRLLLEVGVSISSSGRRYTGLERREHDQGQHDGNREVLSVSSAGMLVRKDVWENLGGFDPAVPLFRDDLDFCWRAYRTGERVMVAPSAVLHHREAAAHNRRTRDEDEARPHAVDREAAIHVLLVQTPTLGLFFNTIRLAIISVYRTIVFLIGKDVSAARDEITAWWKVIAHPGRMRASRATIAKTATEPASSVRHLRPRPGSQFRHAIEVLAGVATTSRVSASSSSISALESGPTDDAAAFLDEDSSGWVSRIAKRPAVLVAVVLVLLSFIAARSVWFAVGTLSGGALLPTPEGAGDLWSSYLNAWHNVAMGSATPSAPYIAVMAVFSTLLIGKASWAITAALLLAIPLAGLSAYYSVRGLITSRWLRAWVAFAYALLPALVAATSTGRLGTAVAAITLPFTARLLVRAVVKGGIRTAAGAAIALAITAAFAPITWVIAAIAMIVGAALYIKFHELTKTNVVLIARNTAIALIAPFFLLMPWSWYALTHPSVVLFEPGLNISGATTALDVILLNPAGPSVVPVWLTIGIVIGGFAALLRRDTWRVVLPMWGVGALALAIGVTQAVIRVAPPSSPVPLSPWPGPATLVLGAVFIVVGAYATQGLRAQFAGSSFTLAQPLSLVIATIAGVAPLLVAVWWIPGGSLQIERGSSEVVPAFVAADADGPALPRTLMLAMNDGVVTYSLVNGAGPVLGDVENAPPAQMWDRLNPIVSDLTSGRGGDEVNQLAGYAVRYVVLDRHNRNAGIAAILDSEPGLRRIANSDGEALWRVSGVTARVRTVDAADAATLVPANASLDPLVSTTVAATPGATLSVGEMPDANWQASINGEMLETAQVSERSPVGWSQVFSMGDRAGSLEVSYDGTARGRWMWLQLIALLVVIVLALPSRRQDDPDPDDDAEPQSLVETEQEVSA